MKLSFDWKKMLLSNVNVRAESHGEAKEPAADLSFKADVPNDFLIDLHPQLKGALYYYDESRNGVADLADQGKKHEPGYAPHLRFGKLGGPLKWEEEMPGAAVSIRVPGATEAMSLEACKVNELQLEPKDGGTVSIKIRVQCKPSLDQYGALAALIQREVEVSIGQAEIGPAEAPGS